MPHIIILSWGRGRIYPTRFLAGSMNRTPTLHNRQARRLSYVYYNASCFYRFLDFVFLGADTRSAPTYYTLLFFYAIFLMILF